MLRPRLKCDVPGSNLVLFNRHLLFIFIFLVLFLGLFLVHSEPDTQCPRCLRYDAQLLHQMHLLLPIVLVISGGGGAPRKHYDSLLTHPHPILINTRALCPVSSQEGRVHTHARKQHYPLLTHIPIQIIKSSPRNSILITTPSFSLTSPSTMHLLILGGTSPTGILLITQLLQVLPTATLTIYARTPSKLPPSLSSHSSLKIIQGELDETDKLSSALPGIDAILSALGPSSTGGKHPPDLPLTRFYTSLLSLMRTHKIKRLIALGTPSISAPQDTSSLTFYLLTSFIKCFFPTAYNDIVAMGKVIQSAGDDIDWTIVRVPFLTDKENGEVNAGFVGDRGVGARVARLGFAVFCAQELVSPKWVRKAVAISSK